MAPPPESLLSGPGARSAGSRITSVPMRDPSRAGGPHDLASLMCLKGIMANSRQARRPRSCRMADPEQTYLTCGSIPSTIARPCQRCMEAGLGFEIVRAVGKACVTAEIEYHPASFSRGHCRDNASQLALREIPVCWNLEDGPSPRSTQEYRGRVHSLALPGPAEAVRIISVTPGGHGLGDDDDRLSPVNSDDNKGRR
ncbi:hypothetical protein BO70DRAFT_400768 [Aspergillus heteromorphus CBS 117.55]|uniref:Uncharacterized protein n=1 Tax=Aspergillus heteromorphus CBS 117.55 TaxID=1448321 RepID=A0A317UYU2_9EURO|nr:uncharacterized protein BO70DRAFT_400768 [Aspergillus heteromorphus CBS 117.55]PWY66786.1 hypothetical protein BO70DRAFT_400768 [Aspergillus heteromorphus CBS 117.55]